jgi:hypothetical protein
LRIFDEYPEIRAENVIADKYGDAWILNSEEGVSISSSSVLKSNLVRFSFFKIMPLIFRSVIYDKGAVPFAREKHYHANIAALSLLGAWFSFLKENHVYDNTRIIIVSDHGENLHNSFPDNTILPDGRSLETYIGVLLVKDFNAAGDLSVDHAFMTNADASLLAVKEIIPHSANPFTHTPLRSDKKNGVTITTCRLWNTRRQEKRQLRYNLMNGSIFMAIYSIPIIGKRRDNDNTSVVYRSRYEEHALLNRDWSRSDSLLSVQNGFHYIENFLFRRTNRRSVRERPL